jgi:hypothetical protein
MSRLLTIATASLMAAVGSLPLAAQQQTATVNTARPR